MLGTTVLRPESMATSQTALLEGPGRRNAVGDIDKTAQLKWLRLRELLPKRSSAESREPSPSAAAGQSVQEDRPGVVDSTAVRPSTFSRLRRAVPGVGRSKGNDAAPATSLSDGRRALPKSQTSVDSYVTAPSQDEYQTVDDDDDDDDDDHYQPPPSLRRLEDRGDAVALIAENTTRRSVPVSYPLAPNELPLVDLRMPAAISNISPDNGGGDFEFDPFDYELETGDSDDDIDAKKVTVPVTICLVIIAGYIFAGAVLFTLWEDWDYLTGSYFCFITLSTIGFGDIVPGTDMDKWASSEKLVLCALWLAFGLSLLAMCFNLMQEEVKEKCKWIGKKLGLLKDGEDDR